MDRIKIINNCNDCEHFSHTGSFARGGGKPCCDHDEVVKAKGYDCFKRIIPHNVSCDENNKKFWEVKTIPSFCPLNKKTGENKEMEEIKDVLIKERINQLNPYIIYIRDYDKMLNLPEEEYQKELKEIKKGVEAHLEYKKNEQTKEEVKEDSLIQIGKQMAEFPQGKTSGELIVDNYDDIMNKVNVIHNCFDNLFLEPAKTKDEYFALRNTSKGIKQFQKDLKEFLLLLDNEKIANLRETINKLLKLLGTKAGKTDGNIENLLIKYKADEQELIFENGYENIVMQKDYREDEDGTLKSEYEKQFLVDTKGMSDPFKMQNIAVTISENFSSKLEFQQLKFETSFSELKAYCGEIAIIRTDDEIIADAKKIVSKEKDLEVVKDGYKNLKELTIKAKAEADKQAAIAEAAQVQAEYEHNEKMAKQRAEEEKQAAIDKALADKEEEDARVAEETKKEEVAEVKPVEVVEEKQETETLTPASTDKVKWTEIYKTIMDYEFKTTNGIVLKMDVLNNIERFIKG